VRAWQAQAVGGAVDDVFVELMRVHYDPGYLKSMRANFKGFDTARRVAIEDGAAATLRCVATALLQDGGAR
jgi:tRNA 2-selenouridine synthase